MTLDQRRKEWEKGLTVVGKVEGRIDDAPHSLVVMLRKDEDLYHVHRYFKVGTSWEISCDGNNMGTENAIRRFAISIVDIGEALKYTGV